MTDSEKSEREFFIFAVLVVLALMGFLLSLPWILEFLEWDWRMATEWGKALKP